jgi:phosphoenolpyruvate---glycerone phosphotransferase subunit DhaL
MTTTRTDPVARTWVDTFAEAVARAATALGEADRKAGDGDFGNNMRAALRRVTRELDTADPGAAGVLTAVSEGFLGVGGTSGPLFGMWFRELGRAVAAAGGITTAALADGVTQGLATVQRLGRAEVGHKTMVDAMAPAADALRRAADAGLPPAEALAAAAAAADEGARSTRDLRARRGRASYVGEHAVGIEDPGARTVALFFTAGATAFGGRS